MTLRTVGGFRDVLRCRELRRLTGAHGAATVAQLMLTLAVSVDVLSRTTSQVWASTAAALAFAPYAVCSGLAGALADRYSRSRVLAASCAARCGLGLLVGLAMVARWPVPVVVVLGAAVAVAATPSYPALMAATPECVTPASLHDANALVGCVENVTWTAGAGAFGLLTVAGLRPGGVVLAGALLCLGAAVAAAPVRTPAPDRAGTGPLAGELTAGLRLVATRPDVRRPMLLALVDNFLYGYLVVALVLLVDGAGGGSGRLGLLTTALAVGAVGASAVVAPLTGRRTSAALVATLGGFCVLVLALSATGPTWVGVAVVLAAGGATLVAEVAAVTLLQRCAEPAALARVFGVYDQLNVGAIAVGSAVAGPLAAACGPRAAVAVTAVGCLAAVLLLARRAASRRGVALA